MLTLTLRQPHAGRVFLLGKNVENRSWATSYRGWLAIHAAAAAERGQPIPASGHRAWTLGAMLGIVELVGIVRDSPSRWAIAGEYHWQLRRPRLLAEPIEMRGKLKLWLAPEDVQTKMRYLQ